MLQQTLRPVALLLSLCVPLWLLWRMIDRLWVTPAVKQPGTGTEILRLACLAYFSCVVAVTLMPIPLSAVDNTSLRALNCIPVVNTIREFTKARQVADIMPIWRFGKNFFGNILLFIPMGIFLPALSVKFRSAKNVLAAAFLLSFTIEALQYISRYFGNYRSADIDDILLNTFGALTGFVCSRWFIHPNSRNDKPIR